MTGDKTPDSKELRGLVVDYIKLARAALEGAHEQGERLEGRLDKLDDRLRDMETAVSALQVKAGLVGFVGGAIPAIVALIYFFLGRK